ncbi:pyruvate kinase [Actinomyces sp. oral taxon 178 str. F0338]|nr:pyruvate kinase [Actinomyces sp. oral taxon 178 str. F0338]
MGVRGRRCVGTGCVGRWHGRYPINAGAALSRYCCCGARPTGSRGAHGLGLTVTGPTESTMLAPALPL